MPIPILNHVMGGVGSCITEKAVIVAMYPFVHVRQWETAVETAMSCFAGRFDMGPLFQDRRPNSQREGSPSDLFHAAGSDTGDRHGCGLLPIARCDIQGGPITAKSSRPESMPTTPVNLTLSSAR